jgi:hypothetical protein
MFRWSPSSSNSGGRLFEQEGYGGRAMTPFEPYRDVLSEHIAGRHMVASAWIVVIAVGIVLMLA